jgi:hypothetical protein
VFARRSEAEPAKLKFFFAAILSLMSPEEIAELCEMVSEELRQTDDEDTIRFVVQVFPADMWHRLDELARLRIENKLISSVADGRWAERQKRCTGGGLGAWASYIVHQFTLKDDLWRTLSEKLCSSDAEQQVYVFQYFIRHADRCFDAPPVVLVAAMNRGLRAGDLRFKLAVESWQTDWAGKVREVDDPWRKPFVDALENFPTEASEITDEDLPF